MRGRIRGDSRGRRVAKAGLWQAKPDDILDAAVAALAAAQPTIATLPADPPVDEVGLRMEIAYGDPRRSQTC